MNPVKYTRSTRSVKSARSAKSMRTIRSETSISEISTLENRLVLACAKFNCPYLVAVKKEIKQDDYYKALKQAETKSRSKRMSIAAPAIERIKSQASDTRATSESTPSSTIVSSALNIIYVTTIYDNFNTLTEISLSKVKEIPCALLKIIVLLAPYYRNLKKIILYRCGIDMYTVHELRKILDVSTITEVCLDGSMLVGANYAMLFEATTLRSVSLCRCNIQDDTCELIASKLHYTASADNLLLLNLSSNHITDAGAKYIGDALRSNRRLRYLNLADNHINDDGAGCLLDVLIDFPLRHDEILNMRRRRLEYYKSRQTLYSKYLAEFLNRSFDQTSQISKKSTATPKRRKTSTTTVKSKGSARRERLDVNDDFIKTKVEMMTTEVLGTFTDPFRPDSVKKVDGYLHSLGNMVLCYLNLGYNSLSHITVIKIEKVLKYQRIIKNPRQIGLIKVVLDGNYMPIQSSELTTVDEIINKNLSMYSRVSQMQRRKSRT